MGHKRVAIKLYTTSFIRERLLLLSAAVVSVMTELAYLRILSASVVIENSKMLMISIKKAWSLRTPWYSNVSKFKGLHLTRYYTRESPADT